MDYRHCLIPRRNHNSANSVEFQKSVKAARTDVSSSMTGTLRGGFAPLTAD
jgi:hypothetical protein